MTSHCERTAFTFISGSELCCHAKGKDVSMERMGDLLPSFSCAIKKKLGQNICGWYNLWEIIFNISIKLIHAAWPSLTQNKLEKDIWQRPIWTEMFLFENCGSCKVSLLLLENNRPHKGEEEGVRRERERKKKTERERERKRERDKECNLLIHHFSSGNKVLAWNKDVFKWSVPVITIYFPFRDFTTVDLALYE